MWDIDVCTDLKRYMLHPPQNSRSLLVAPSTQHQKWLPRWLLEYCSPLPYQLVYVPRRCARGILTAILHWMKAGNMMRGHSEKEKWGYLPGDSRGKLTGLVVGHDADGILPVTHGMHIHVCVGSAYVFLRNL